jgi:16S rRNA G966 N2-methylase RsmD
MTQQEATSEVECLGRTFADEDERRTYFLELLRSKLRDPEFRRTEGFPSGSEEDILALSDPPYYTACPNPFVADFVRCHGTPHHPDCENHSSGPFPADVGVARHDHYTLGHTYHTKVSPLAVAQYIEHSTRPGDLVLDCFCGSGMTGLAALGTPVDIRTKRLHATQPRRAVLVDLSPAATHIASGYLTSFSPADLDRIEQLLAEAQTRDEAIYSVPHAGHPERITAWQSGPGFCGGKFPTCLLPDGQAGGLPPQGTLEYLVWSEILLCPSCPAEVVFGAAAFCLDQQKVTRDLLCPNCDRRFRKTSARRKYVTTHDPLLDRPVRLPALAPLFTAYRHDGRRYYRRAIPADVFPDERLDLSSCPASLAVLRGERYHKDALHNVYGVSHIHHFYLRRALQPLGRLYRLARELPDRLRRLLLFLLTSVSVKTSRLMNYNADGVGRVMKGTLYQSSLIQECNVYWMLGLALADLRRLGKASVHDRRHAILSTGSAERLPLPDDSVDHIFIDPPFGRSLMYAELNQLWEWWLGVRSAGESEAVVDERRGKDLESYHDLMTRCFRECCRVLKPGRWITIEFHNSDRRVWTALQEAIRNAGFVIGEVRTLDKRQTTFKQNCSTNAVKQDLVISAYKPDGRLDETFRLHAGTVEGGWEFVTNHLRQALLPAERRGDLLFARMVAFHLRRGLAVPLSAGDFYAGLKQRFAERDGLFFLPEEVVDGTEVDSENGACRTVLSLP